MFPQAYHVPGAFELLNRGLAQNQSTEVQVKKHVKLVGSDEPKREPCKNSRETRTTSCVLLHRSLLAGYIFGYSNLSTLPR